MIIEYKPPFRKDGSIYYDTRVVCECDWCSKKWETSQRKIESSKSGGSRCRICMNRDKPPMLPKEFLEENRTVTDVIGPLTKRGYIQKRTRVTYKCELCGIESTTSINNLERNKSGCDICKTCYRDGSPYTKDQALNDYNTIKEVKPLNNRNHVSSDTMCIVECSECGNELDVNFGGVKRQERDYWKCSDCANVLIHKSRDEVIYPKNVPDLEYDEDTLGVWGQFQAKTRIYLECKDCGDEIATVWGLYHKHNYYCSSCSKKHVWADPETRNNILSSRYVPTRMSGEHKKFKEYMLKEGIGSFDSEQWIPDTRYIVDEVDHDRKIGIEYYGDYYHGNPELYDPYDVIRYEDQDLYVHEKWEEDLKRKQEIEEAGYSIFVVWGNDFNNCPDEVINKIKQWIDKYEL